MYQHQLGAKLNDSNDLPKYGDSGDGKFSKKFGQGRFVIPAPLEVDALMKKVPKGKLTTINKLRAALSKKHKTDFACPITIGIFSWIAAHAADEMAREGCKRITRYGRTLKSDGQINPKYLGGIEAILEKLEAKGHTVIQKGKRFLVADFEKKQSSQNSSRLPCRWPSGLNGGVPARLQHRIVLPAALACLGRFSAWPDGRAG